MCAGVIEKGPAVETRLSITMCHYTLRPISELGLSTCDLAGRNTGLGINSVILDLSPNSVVFSKSLNLFGSQVPPLSISSE